MEGANHPGPRRTVNLVCVTHHLPPLAQPGGSDTLPHPAQPGSSNTLPPTCSAWRLRYPHPNTAPFTIRVCASEPVRFFAKLSLHVDQATLLPLLPANLRDA